PPAGSAAYLPRRACGGLEPPGPARRLPLYSGRCGPAPHSSCPSLQPTAATARPCAAEATDRRMRLSTIKLSGFKSFVDPTTLHLPTNMTGVVGPNGCGKSNIIDAVRWVMGESSASRLRGDSLTDVIFSGSTSR